MLDSSKKGLQTNIFKNKKQISTLHASPNKQINCLQFNRLRLVPISKAHLCCDKKNLLEQT